MTAPLLPGQHPTPAVPDADPNAPGSITYACGHVRARGFGPPRSDPSPCRECQQAEGAWRIRDEFMPPRVFGRAGRYGRR